MAGGRVRFDGDVGIGVALPESKLQVNGNVAIGFGAAPTGVPTNGLGVAGAVGIGPTELYTEGLPGLDYSDDCRDPA